MWGGISSKPVDRPSDRVGRSGERRSQDRNCPLSTIWWIEEKRVVKKISGRERHTHRPSVNSLSRQLADQKNYKQCALDLALARPPKEHHTRFRSLRVADDTGLVLSLGSVIVTCGRPFVPRNLELAQQVTLLLGGTLQGVVVGVKFLAQRSFVGIGESNDQSPY